MKKIIILLLLNCFISALLLSDNINKYNIALVKIISTGSEEGSIGWDSLALSAGGVPGPSTFVISRMNKIYIPDRNNKRINVYDINFNYLKYFIDDEKMCAYTDHIKFDKNENLIVNLSYKGLKKIDQQGNLIFKIDGRELPKSVKNRKNYFPLDEYIFYYNDNEEIELLSGSGKKESRDKILKMINKLSEKNSNIEDLPDDKKKIPGNLRKELKHIIIGEQFYSSDFSKTREYFEKLKVINTKKSDEDQTRGTVNNEEIEINLDKYYLGLIGYDREHNSYWRAIEKQEVKGIKNQLIVIFSKYGDLLDAFYRGQFLKNETNTEIYPTSGAKVTVAPSGDIYFMVEPDVYFVPPSKESEARGGEGSWMTPDNAQFKFYKVTRQW